MNVFDAKRLWMLCYDVATNFQKTDTPAGNAFFQRAKECAVSLENDWDEKLGGLQSATKLVRE